MTTKMLWILLMATILSGCATVPPKLHVKDSDLAFGEGTIISGKTGRAVSFDDMLVDLAASRVVFVGERHTDAAHHRIQLKIIKAMTDMQLNLAVGMEMFDITYQPVLDRWSAGELEQDVFLEKVQWYANWRYDFDLYRDILDYVKMNRIRLVGINIPTYLPSRVRVGGLANLLDVDKAFLPQDIDTANEAHRAYMEPIYKRHSLHSFAKFEYWYQAQCLWEDAMAASVSRELADDVMVVLVGGGHIIYKFGVPDRFFRRTGLPFRTVYLEPAGGQVELAYADYIWVTPPAREKPHRMGR